MGSDPSSPLVIKLQDKGDDIKVLMRLLDRLALLPMRSEHYLRDSAWHKLSEELGLMLEDRTTTAHSNTAYSAYGG